MNQKPNLLIIQTDQQNRWTLGCYGGMLIDTPHIDSLADQGVRFDNFFTNSAICTPSRGCFITGRYPHAHGAYKNNVPLNPDVTTLAHILKANGYETAYMGKWHLGGEARPGWMKPEDSMGFDECRYMFNRGHWKEVLEQENSEPAVNGENIGSEETYMTDWLTNKTIDFIKKDHPAPFFCMLSIPDPHTPFTVRPPYASMYAPEGMPLPETFHEEPSLDWVKHHIESKREFAGTKEEREEKLRGYMAQYCGEVKCIDDNVGKILKTLEQQGIDSNTIIVFTTDHGEYMGEHGLLGKNNLYETAYRIPFIMKWPQGIRGGTLVERFVSTVDFQQSILGLMEMEACGSEQGRDASPLIRGQEIEWTDEVFLHPNTHQSAGIITPEFELAYVGEVKAGEKVYTLKDHILFNRRKDWNQIENLFSDPVYRESIGHLTRRMAEHYSTAGCPSGRLPLEVCMKGSD